MIAARRARTPATLVRNSTVPRLSSMGLQAAEAAFASAARAASSSLVPMMAGAGLDQQDRRGDSAQRHAGGGDGARGVQRQADRGRSDSDVHFGAGNEAQISVGRTGRHGREERSR